MNSVWLSDTTKTAEITIMIIYRPLTKLFWYFTWAAGLFHSFVKIALRNQINGSYTFAGDKK
jgi:hypothetical protein